MQTQKFQISEMDIQNTRIYQLFDQLSLELKKIFLNHFIQNYKNQKNEKKVQNQITPKVVSPEEKKGMNLIRHQSADPNPKSMQPSELRFINLVKQEISSFYQQIAKLNEIFTIKRKDLKKTLQLNQLNSQQMQQQNDRQQTLNLVNYLMIEEQQLVNQNEEGYYKIDVIENKMNQQVMALSLFKIVLKSSQNEIQTIKTFPFIIQEEQQNQLQKTYLKFNQQIGFEEIDILNYGNKMVNSNIINAYMNHLMIQDEKEYFSLNIQQREQYSRLYIFGSEFVTDCGIDGKENQSQEFLQQKYLYLWLKYLDKFKAINYNFMLIYKKIGFVVNLSNRHWYFVQVIFDNKDKKLVIFDSLKKTQSTYSNIVNLLKYLFRQSTNDSTLNFEVLIENNFPQQQENYSCGYYTCIAANYLSKQDKKFQKINEIKSELRRLLLKQDVNDVKLIDFDKISIFCC